MQEKVQSLEFRLFIYLNLYEEYYSKFKWLIVIAKILISVIRQIFTCLAQYISADPIILNIKLIYIGLPVYGKL